MPLWNSQCRLGNKINTTATWVKILWTLWNSNKLCLLNTSQQCGSNIFWQWHQASHMIVLDFVIFVIVLHCYKLMWVSHRVTGTVKLEYIKCSYFVLYPLHDCLTHLVLPPLGQICFMPGIVCTHCCYFFNTWFWALTRLDHAWSAIAVARCHKFHATLLM